MLGWPLNWNMSRDIQRNDLERYEIPETDDRSPAMTWSWFTIGWRWVNEPSKVENYFEKSYRDYMIQPFKVRITKKYSGGSVVIVACWVLFTPLPHTTQNLNIILCQIPRLIVP